MTRQRVNRQGMRFAIRKREANTLNKVRYLIAMKQRGLAVPGRPDNAKRIFDSNLSWQEKIKWVERILAYPGERTENLEWFTVLYNDEEKAVDLMAAKSNRMTGDKNPGFNHNGRLSPFSKKSHFYDPTLSKRVNDKLNETGNRSNRIEHYLMKGFGLCQAMTELKERQAVSRLENFIKRYGEEEGQIRWTERQEKWMNTLNSKSEEEKALINSKKMCQGYTISKAETFIYNELSNHFECEKSVALSYNDTKNYYVYDIKVGKILIEYNGDFWHANPEMFDESFYNKVSKLNATEIWEKETHKEKVASNHGYIVYRIWEKQFREDKRGTIEKCINYLKQSKENLSTR